MDVIDHTPQQGAVRASTADLRDFGKRGLIWLLDEESLFPGASEKSFLDKLFMTYSGKGKKVHSNIHFYLLFLQKVLTISIVY